MVAVDIGKGIVKANRYVHRRTNVRVECRVAESRAAVANEAEVTGIPVPPPSLLQPPPKTMRVVVHDEVVGAVCFLKQKFYRPIKDISFQLERRRLRCYEAALMTTNSYNAAAMPSLIHHYCKVCNHINLFGFL